MEPVNIFWFRRDLRLNDNTALYHALKSELPVLPIFIFDKNILDKLENKNDRRVNFIHETLCGLQSILQKKYNSGITTFYGKPEEVWKEITSKYKINTVFFNEDYEPYARKRDQKILNLLEKENINVQYFHDHCVFKKNQILKNDQTPYVQYTAFKNAWLANLTEDDYKVKNSKRLLKNLKNYTSKPIISLKKMGFTQNETNLSLKVDTNILLDYDKTRDIPHLNATSLLGIHLRFGTISVRECVRFGIEFNQVWLSEIVWREFFSQILFHYPKVVNAPFKEKFESIKWRNNKAEFKKWKEGKTGFPIVDAGIRELLATGHMHNRVRMIVASFLIKDLLIDWRWGERFFAQHLLDYDLASNNGNWQWVAGTGCDSAPYFRIFNPETQRKKFDPEFKYIKKWIPEFETDAYPAPMIDHKEAYHRALLAYKV